MSLTTLFSGIAGAIREKDGSSGVIAATAFPDRIRAIPLYEHCTVDLTGSTAWTVPDGVSQLSITCIGGGGGGGGTGGYSMNGNKSYNGGYGAAGALGQKSEGTFAVTAGTVLTVTVGAGGMSGTTGGTVSQSSTIIRGLDGSVGLAGGASSVSASGISLSAEGGAGGTGGHGATPSSNGRPTEVQLATGAHEGFGDYGKGGKSQTRGYSGLVELRFEKLRE